MLSYAIKTGELVTDTDYNAPSLATAKYDFETKLHSVQALEYEDAAAYLQETALLAEAVKTAGVPEFLRIRVLAELGNARRASGRFEESLTVLNEAISAGEKLPAGNERDAVLALANLNAAIACDVVGELVEGFRHIDEATRYYSGVRDENGLARCDMVRAALYLRLQDYPEAETCYRRALDHYRKAGDSERIGVALINLSTTLRYQDRTAEAINAGREALEHATSTLLITTARGSLASALADAGELDEALELHLSTQDAITALGHPNYLITHWRTLATVRMQRGEHEEALSLLRQALELAVELDFSRDISESHGLLAETLASMGDFEAAYRHQTKYHEMEQEKNADIVANQLEFHKWRLKVESAEREAEEERQRRKRLADSYEEITRVNEQLTARAEKLEWSSYRDSLTELANRRYFDQRLGDLVKHTAETQSDLSVLILDLDRFKDVNDRYGHLLGDQVLRATAQILRAMTRRTDISARLGGEEFAVLLSNHLDPENLHTLADKIRRAFVDYEWNELAPGLRVTVSIGGARLSEVDGNPLKLLDLADRRMYSAKRAGRNTVVTDGTETELL